MINYTPTAFYAYSIDAVLRSQGSEVETRNKLFLRDALTQHFLNCRVGNMDLRYDAITRKLTWRDHRGAVVATKFSIPHRIRLKIQSPNAMEPVAYEKLIPFNEIHDHRMQAEPEEMLAPLLSERPASIKSQKRSLSMTYHPDRYAPGDQLLRDLMTRRMQEINAAYDLVESKRVDGKGDEPD